MISRTHLIWLAGLVLGDMFLGVVAIGLLPNRVPVHWDFRGEIDRYGSPWELAFILPVVVMLVAALLVAIPSIGSISASLQRSRATYGRVSIAIVTLLVAIHAILLMAVWERPWDVPTAILIALSLLLLILGNSMGKIRRNSVVGIRTPWTLQSDRIWERTHRIGGRLQVLHGLTVLASAILLPTWATLVVLLLGLIALVLWAFLYSRSLALHAQ